MISVVAQNYNIHPQTLRLYEREGLLKPSRTEGNTRLYSEEDLEQLETILSLTRDLGVNLAGVEIVLNMRRKIEEMQGEVNEFVDYVSKSCRAASATGSSAEHRAREVVADRSRARRRRRPAGETSSAGAREPRTTAECPAPRPARDRSTAPSRQRAARRTTRGDSAERLPPRASPSCRG